MNHWISLKSLEVNKPAGPGGGHAPGRRLLLVLAAAVLVGCASLSHQVVPLGGADTASPADSAIISVASDQPLLLEGFDGQRLPKANLPNPLRSHSFAATPGSHVLWLSSVPYGVPLVPQRLRCYEMHVRLEAGFHYVLEEMPAHKSAALLIPGRRDPVAYGRIVDNPWIFRSKCRWP